MNWQPITDKALAQHGPFLVTNNPGARTSFDTMSHCWCVSLIQKDGDEYIAFDGYYAKLHGLSMYVEVTPPSLSPNPIVSAIEVGRDAA